MRATQGRGNESESLEVGLVSTGSETLLSAKGPSGRSRPHWSVILLLLACGVLFFCAWIAIRSGKRPGHTHPTLVHRYSFVENAHDSISGAHGILHDGARIEGGAVVLEEGKGYVSLPLGRTLADMGSATLEAWVVWNGGPHGQRIFDIGESPKRNIYLTPKGYPSATAQLGYHLERVHEGPLLTAALSFARDRLVHVVVTLDGPKRLARLYLNGGLVMQNRSLSCSPMDLGSAAVGWLGRSRNTQDPAFRGRITEFRVYRSALSPWAIRASYAAGPDTIRMDKEADIERAAVRLIADSAAQFGKLQGGDHWYYGYMDRSGEGDFTEFPQYSEEAGVWQHDATAAPSTRLWDTGGRPVLTANGIEQWAVRRWVSPIEGSILISGVLALSGGTCGDGVGGMIRVDGVEVWSRLIAFNDTQGAMYQVRATVRAGSTVDLVITPGGFHPTDHCDETTFITQIYSLAEDTATDQEGESVAHDQRPDYAVDSAAEFSFVQGYLNWYYGYVLPGTGFDFLLMNEYSGARWTVEEGTYWTMLTPLGAKPNAVHTDQARVSAEQWPVRRWISPSSALVVLSIRLAKAPGQLCGDGATAHVLVDGRSVWSRYVPADDDDGRNYAITIKVEAGSAVDFAVSPGLSDLCDDLVFTVGMHYAGQGAHDCNNNGIADEIDIVRGVSRDEDGDGLPDECLPLPEVLFVDSKAAAGGDGLSWAGAFRELEEAMTAARSRVGARQIWVAAGEYRPVLRTDPHDPRSATFQLVNNVALYGGFAGGESELEERDPQSNRTILSGRPHGDEGANRSNCYHVVSSEGNDPSAVLDGFIITGGGADGPFIANGSGGGILVQQSARPTITNCTIMDNYARNGGGLACLGNAAPHISHCHITRNRAAGRGGGIYARGASPHIRSSRILGNEGRSGGGMACFSGAHAVIEDCTIGGNQAETGGGVAVSGSHPSIHASLVSGNTAGQGGGMHLRDNTAATVSHCVLSGNAATLGGAVYARSMASPKIVNCVIDANEADWGGGVFFGQRSTAVIVNSILTANTGHALAETDAGARTSVSFCQFDRNPQGVYWDAAARRSYFTATAAGRALSEWKNNREGDPLYEEGKKGIWSKAAQYDAARGCTILTDASGLFLPGELVGRLITPDINHRRQAIIVANTAETIEVIGNVSNIVDQGDTYDLVNYRPRFGSPCIDAGDNTALVAEISTDLAGHVRPADNPCVPDTGVSIGGQPVVDIGVYESSDAPVPSARLYVRAGARGGKGDGSSWEDALGDLQAALGLAACATVAEIWVAEGTYTPTGPGGNRQAGFQLVEGVAVYGGFAGGESEFDQRNPLAHPTVLSGDLNGDDSSDTSSGKDNCVHVVIGPRASEAPGPAILDGFIITGGHADDSGGGLYCTTGRTSIVDCLFTENTAMGDEGQGGGAIACLDGAELRLTRCRIQNNYCPNGQGGGIYARDASPILVHCLIVDNLARRGGGAAAGGRAHPLLLNNTFLNNLAEFGGAMFFEQQCRPMATNCIVTGNQAGAGGAICTQDEAQPEIVNCIFDQNTADKGGALYIQPRSVPTVANCIFTGNAHFAVYEAGPKARANVSFNRFHANGDGVCFDGERNQGVDSAVAGNAALTTWSGNSDGDPGFVEPIIGTWTDPPVYDSLNCRTVLTDASAALTIEKTQDRLLVDETEQRVLGMVLGCSATRLEVTGNLEAYPAVGRAYRLIGYQLRPRSPCIDAGDNTALPGDAADLDGDGVRDEPLPWDRAAQPRVVGNPCLPKTGRPAEAKAIVDQGVYEAPAPPMPPERLYVNAEVKGGTGSGDSWVNALIGLESALEWAACGTVKEIWVARGTYTPAPAGGKRGAAFRLVNKVAIYGGFVGTEMSVEERNFSENVTCLSGDLNDDDHGGGNKVSNDENSYHVLLAENCEAETVLDGFTITGGNANGPDAPYHGGGGMYIDGGGPTIRNCTFIENYASGDGGAVHVTHGALPVFHRCLFYTNLADRGGGAVSHGDESGSTMLNCVFVGNGADQGGAVYNGVGGHALLIHCTLCGNWAGRQGGGVSSGERGSISVYNSILWGNRDSSPDGRTAQLAGGILDVQYSCIADGDPNDEAIFSGTGNIDDDPLFVDIHGQDGLWGTADDDLRLTPASPCLNAGSNDHVPPEVDRDLDGHPRIYNGTVDMGAYELTGFMLARAVSRKSHGLAGDFDLELPLPASAAAIEGREGGPTRVVLTFSEELNPAISCANLILSSGQCESVSVSGAEMLMTLSGVTDNACLTITLQDVRSADGETLMGDHDVHIRVVSGEADGIAPVSPRDMALVKGHLFQPIGPRTFRYDVLTDGIINVQDMERVNRNLGHSATCP